MKWQLLAFIVVLMAVAQAEYVDLNTGATANLGASTKVISTLNSVTATVGDENNLTFQPSLKISRQFFEDANFTISWDANVADLSNAQLSIENRILKYKKTAYELWFYQLPDDANTPEGGFEFMAKLNSKPTKNTISFKIDTKNLDFFYQAPLEAKGKYLGITCNATTCMNGTEIMGERPFNVVGSYAVYHTTKANNKYQTGKVMHIYRPFVNDSIGKSTWANLSIIGNSMLMTIEQKFLDTAIYPIYIDPSFGYTTVGESLDSDTRGINAQFANTTPATSGSLISISIYGKSHGSLGGTFDTALYLGNSTYATTLLNNSNISNSPEFNSTSIYQWLTNNLTYFNITKEVQYWLGHHSGSITGIDYKYDSCTNNEQIYKTTSTVFINPFPGAASLAKERVSIYANYTENAPSSVPTAAINISAPLNNTAYPISTSFRLNVTFIGNYSSYILNYSLDNAINVSVGNVLNNTLNSTSIGYLTAGLHNITVFAINETVINTSYVNFSVNGFQVGNCPYTINTAGSWTVINDIAYSGTGNCINVNTANVNLDCNNYTITATSAGGSTGIYTESNNLTVKNCNIRKIDNGIVLSGSSNSNIYYSNISNSVTAGILAIGSTYSTISHNWLDGVGVATDGIYLTSMSSHSLTYNNTIMNHTTNIHSSASTNVTILNNQIFGTGIGIRVSSTELNITDNIISITGNSNALWLNSASRNSIINNSITISGATIGVGIYFYPNSYNNTANNNYVSGADVAYEFGTATGNIITGGSVVVPAAKTFINSYNSVNNTFINISNPSTGTYDIYHWGTNSQLNFLNVTLNYPKIYYDAGVNANQTIQWYARVQTVTGGSALAGATVNITNSSTTTPQFIDLTTDANGFTSWQILTEVIGNNTKNTTYTPHNVSGIKSGYNLNSSLFTINSSQTVVLSLTATSSPTISFIVFTMGGESNFTNSNDTTANYTEAIYFNATNKNQWWIQPCANADGVTNCQTGMTKPIYRIVNTGTVAINYFLKLDSSLSGTPFKSCANSTSNGGTVSATVSTCDLSGAEGNLNATTWLLLGNLGTNAQLNVTRYANVSGTVPVSYLRYDQHNSTS